MAERKRNTKTNSAKTEAAEEVKITDSELVEAEASAEKEEVSEVLQEESAALTATEQQPEASETAPSTEEAPKAEATFTQEQVEAMIKQAVTSALANQTPQIVQIAADVEKVHFLFQAEVADDNRLSIGGKNSGYAPIIGRYGEFVIPKSDLSRVMDGQFKELLRKRWLIVVSGLTDEEREIYGVNYKEGEILDKMAFTKMVELEDKILDIYPKLCEGHREMVAKRFYEAYMDKNPHVRREIVSQLNRLSVELGSEHGDFDAILEAMNEADRKH